MRSPQKAKAKHRSRRLSSSAKISDYRFRRVLWYFVLDRTATETARELRLSTNSVVAIFQALRGYFTEVGLFTDYYGGRQPGHYDGADELFELKLLEFHLARVRAKRGLVSPISGPDYHFSESHWRFHFHVLMGQRPSEQVRAMMISHLLEIIGICGPVRRKPINQQAGLLAVMRQMDQRILWLERNAVSFRSYRTELRTIYAIRPRI